MFRVPRWGLLSGFTSGELSEMKRTHPRRGFSLIEMLVTMATGSLVIGLILATIHVILGAQQQGEARARQQLGISRLNAQFRKDIAEAEEIQLEKQENESDSLTLRNGEKRLRWSVVSNGLSRESISPGSSPVRDLYWLGTGISSNWNWNSERRLAEVSLQIPRRFVADASSERSPQVELRDSLSIVAIAESLAQAEEKGK